MSYSLQNGGDSEDNMVYADEAAPSGERPKNFPPCRPMVRHDINSDIPSEARAFVWRMYGGYYAHIFCVFLNGIAYFAAIFTDMGEGSAWNFIVSIIYTLGSMILAPPIAFVVYYQLYRALRDQSGFPFILWMGLFGLRIVYEIWSWIGRAENGNAGMLMMVIILPNIGTYPVQISLVIASTIAWTLLTAFDIVHLLIGRGYYRRLGGMAAVAQDFKQTASQAIYDNRGTIANAVVALNSPVDNKPLPSPPPANRYVAPAPAQPSPPVFRKAAPAPAPASMASPPVSRPPVQSQSSWPSPPTSPEVNRAALAQSDNEWLAKQRATSFSDLPTTKNVSNDWLMKQPVIVASNSPADPFAAQAAPAVQQQKPAAPIFDPFGFAPDPFAQLQSQSPPQQRPTNVAVDPFADAFAPSPASQPLTHTQAYQYPGAAPAFETGPAFH